VVVWLSLVAAGYIHTYIHVTPVAMKPRRGIKPAVHQYHGEKQPIITTRLKEKPTLVRVKTSPKTPSVLPSAL